MIAYFFEKEYKFNLDNPIILLFDATDSGYSNTVGFINSWINLVLYKNYFFFHSLGYGVDQICG